MSHSVRFLALAIAAWAGVRAIAFSFDPGHDAIAATRDDSKLPEAAQGPSAPASAPSPAPAPGMRQSVAQPYAATPYGAYYAPPGWVPMAGYAPAAYAPAAAVAPTVIRVEVPVPVPVAASAPAGWEGTPMAMTNSIYDPGQFPVAAIAPTGATAATAPLATPALGEELAKTNKPLRLHGWAFYRDETQAGATPGLAAAGQLGGSQVGVRALYRVKPGIDVAARYTSSVGTLQGSEAALGLRVQPLKGVPLAVTAERRERIDGIGRSAFSLFGEYGVYGRPLPARLSLDAYAQAGVVGMKSRDWFVDAQLTATRPFWRGMSLGGGVWTAAQPGLSRVDVGPRVSMPVPGGMKLHADYRVRLVGKAAPDTGAAVTLAGDF